MMLSLGCTGVGYTVTVVSKSPYRDSINDSHRFLTVPESICSKG